MNRADVNSALLLLAIVVAGLTLLSVGAIAAAAVTGGLPVAIGGGR